MRAFKRYEDIIFDQKTLWTRSPVPAKTLPLSSLKVVVPSSLDIDKYPALGDNERSRSVSAWRCYAARFYVQCRIGTRGVLATDH